MKQAPDHIKDQAGIESEISTYYGSSDHSDAYNDCWGESNIHVGYFPHLENKNKPILGFQDAAKLVTQKMGELGKLDKNSYVIDFGCGMGGPSIDLVKTFGSKVIGIDLTQEHIDSCKLAAIKNNINDEKRLKFIQGSFVDLPENIVKNSKDIKFTHCFSQMAIYHVSDYFDKVISSAYNILDKNGILIWSDFTGQDVKPSDKCMKHFYKRLHVKKLLSDGEYIQSLTKGGFEILYYQMLGDHCGYGYKLLEKSARKGKFVSEDGVLLADHYKATHQVIDDGEVGYNLVIARKK